MEFLKSTAMNSKLSFTIRHLPSSSAYPILRRANTTPYQLEFGDEESGDDATKFVAGQCRTQRRLHKKPTPPSGPLVIAPLANRDFGIARKQQRFVPDGSQGGLGTRDTINSGLQVAGLVMRGEVVVAELEEKVMLSGKDVTGSAVKESEDERARKALLSGACGNGDTISIDAIPLEGNSLTHPSFNETDAYPDNLTAEPAHGRLPGSRLETFTASCPQATLADYERVPVSQFGVALLRGMGWKEGTSASRKRQGPVEPWLPTSRPAFLGIGAKERAPEDIPAAKSVRVDRRSDKRYVPVIKMQRKVSMQSPHPCSRFLTRPESAYRVSAKSSFPYQGDKNTPFKRHTRDKTCDDYDQNKSGREGNHGGRGHHRDVDHSRLCRNYRVESRGYGRDYEGRTGWGWEGP